MGTSGHASRVVVAALARSDSGMLVGALGSNLSSTRAFADKHGVRAYKALDELLEDREVDAVWIATPNNLHADQAIACAAAGKHMLIEKPLATSAEDAARIVDAVRKSPVHAHVGYQHRFRPVHGRIRSVIQAGTLGRIGLVRIHRYWRFPYFEHEGDAAAPSPWRQSMASSGGWVTSDIATHLVDLAMWTTGEAMKGIHAVLATQRFDFETEDTAVLVLKLGQAGVVSIEASAALRSPGSLVEFYGEEGWVRAIDSFGPVALLQMSDGSTEEYVVPDWIDPYSGEVDDLSMAIRGEASVGATVGDGAANAAIMEVLRSTATMLRAD